MSETSLDVAIIGGGPGGSTLGGFLRKYDPKIKVAIFEREAFPRDHVGESQLPIIGNILDELGVWDKIEAAGFPVKIGATYRWGKTDDLWDFHFLPNGRFYDEPRPSKFAGQRTKTAFQVDRAIYDKILLDHAEQLGCEVYTETTVREIAKDQDKVTELVLQDGTRVRARHYVDASGHSGILRRAMGVGIEQPSNLQNIAIWDYWQNAEWAVSVGVGGTRVQVMSVGYGWLWFIPLGPTRVSIGFICPADHYKKSGLTPQALYDRAISEEPLIKGLTLNGTPEGKLSTTKDWSFVAERMAGQNWYLVGESAGFADPILAAGLTLTHVSARECAFSVLEERRGGDPKWLQSEYEERNYRRILQHIRFADYWYTANENFGELKEYTREIAKDAGLELDAEKAFQWLGTGGFVDEDLGVGGVGTFSLRAIHDIARRFSDASTEVAITGLNYFTLRLRDATLVNRAVYEAGGVRQIKAYTREGKFLPMFGLFGAIVNGLQASPRIDHLLNFLHDRLQRAGITPDESMKFAIYNCLEAMQRDNWIKGKRVEGLPIEDFGSSNESTAVVTNRDEQVTRR